MLHADMTLRSRDGLVEDVVARDIAEQLAIARAETLDAVGRQQHLADRQQHDLVAFAGGELAHRIERADRFQDVAEQVEPQRLVRARRIEIDQAAADRELAGLHHRVGPAIAVRAEILRQAGDVDARALAQDRRRLGIEAARRHLLQHCPS